MAKAPAVKATLVALVAALAVAPAASAAVTITTAGDAWTTSQFPVRNLGTQAVMRVNSKPVKRAFVRFDVATPGVTRAVLRVFAQTTGSRGFEVYTTPAAWSETTITHQNAPVPGVRVAQVPAFTATNTWREIDVTSAVTGVGPVSFMITIPSATADLTLTSKEGGRPPELVLETGNPPTPVSPPSVSGTAVVGQTLTAVAGTWTGTLPISYAYQWQRCDATGGACVDVTGAIDTAYVVGTGDAGRTIRVRETATNAAGSASAASSATAVVPVPILPPTSIAPPTVTGTGHLGQTLTAVSGAWTGTPPIALTLQWLRCDTTGGACVEVTGAIGTTYLLDTPDLGSTIRVRETASNGQGTESATSAATGVVVDDPPPPPAQSCSRADATGCATLAGSRINLLNQKFSCDRPLAEIAAQNPIGGGPGRLPLLVDVDFTTYLELSPAVVDLRQDCAGDGDDTTIDLILDIDGDGRTRGGMVDAIKVRLTAHDIQVTGEANCGPRGLGADGLDGTRDDLHQDGAQLQGGDTIEFIDFEWGDWETSTATCQGAAGTFATGMVNATAPVTNMACIRCKSVSCNHGMAIGSGSQNIRVEDSRWRTSNPADMAVPLATGAVGICRFGSPACIVDTTSHNGFPPPVNVTVVRNTCDTWPYEGA
jgi:hypothetical protein